MAFGASITNLSAYGGPGEGYVFPASTSNIDLYQMTVIVLAIHGTHYLTIAKPGVHGESKIAIGIAISIGH